MQYPVLVFHFWYLTAPKGILAYFASLNASFSQLFSIALLLRTFFKPWRNEYREGLVGFSIVMGMIVKSCVLLASFVLFVVLLLVEAALFIGFLLWPIFTVYLLFL